MNSRHALVFLLSMIVLSAVGGRLYARKSASEFGAALANAQSHLSRDAFADSSTIRGLLEKPELKSHRNVVNRFAILGGGYKVRIGELQQGLIFLSEQMAKPENRRSLNPPALRHFTIEMVTTSDRSVFDAAAKLIHDFRSQVSQP